MSEPFGNEFMLSSGYDVFIEPLPPYYKDLIDQQFPLPKYPQRQIKLLAGDVVDWPYEPPDEELPEDHEDYDLYMMWHTVDRQRKDIIELRNVARVEYLLSMCVTVLDGPYKVEDEEWVDRIEAAFPNFHVPTHKGKRRLLFLKHVVIRTNEEMELILNMCTSPEVTMQGVITALHGFQDSMEERRFARGSK